MSYRKFLILALVVPGLLFSCGGTTDISGNYKGTITLKDQSKKEHSGQIDIILNQRETNLSGSLTFPLPLGTMEIRSGVVKDDAIAFVAGKKGRDRNLMGEYEIEIRFDGKIDGKELEGNWVWTTSGYRMVGEFPNFSPVPVSETFKGTLLAIREK